MGYQTKHKSTTIIEKIKKNMENAKLQKIVVSEIEKAEKVGAREELEELTYFFMEDFVKYSKGSKEAQVVEKALKEVARRYQKISKELQKL